jgi:hypothetical protein
MKFSASHKCFYVSFYQLGDFIETMGPQIKRNTVLLVDEIDAALCEAQVQIQQQIVAGPQKQVKFTWLQAPLKGWDRTVMFTGTAG